MNCKFISIWVILLGVCVWQSYGVSAAACGTYATIGTDPVIAMKNVGLISITALGGSSLVYHGNADGSCGDAYSFSPLSSTTLTTSQEWSFWKGSETIYGCATSNTFCTVSRLVPFYNPRQGAWKTSMITTTPNRAWSAPSAAASTSFSLQILAGTSTYTTLAAAAYTFQISVSSHRTCLVREQQFSGAGITVTAAALTVTVTASLSVGLYSVCMQVIRSGSTLATWFPLSAALGHSAHNLPIGLPATDVTWSLDSTPTGGSRLLYGDNLTFYVESQAVTDGWTYFAVDTSADVCSPLLANQIQSTSLTTFNATHMRGYITVSRPLGSPGGGDAALCGSRGATAPWQLISSRSTQTVYYCPVGYSTRLTSPNLCGYCLPNASAQCNNRGKCGDVETKTYYADQLICSCDSGYYGNACQYTDLPTPTDDKPSGTYRVRHLYVSVTIVSWATDLRVVYDNTGITEIFGGNTTLVFSESGGFSAVARLSDGSESLAPLRETYIIEMPTLTPTLTATQTTSLSFSGSPSESTSGSATTTSSLSDSQATDELTATKTITPPPTMTATRTQSISPTQTTSFTQTISGPTWSATDSGTISTSTSKSRTRVPTPTASASEEASITVSEPSFSVTTSSSLLETTSMTLTLSATSSPTFSGTHSATDMTFSNVVIERSETIPSVSLSVIFPLRFVRLTPDDYQTPLPSDDPIHTGVCLSSDCTDGISFRCDTLEFSAHYIVPRIHNCTVTTRNALNQTLEEYREILITPRHLELSDLRESLLEGVPRIVVPQRYQISHLPANWRSVDLSLASCREPFLWTSPPFFCPLSEQCVAFHVTSPGFEDLTGTLFLPQVHGDGDTPSSVADRLKIERLGIDFDPSASKTLEAGASMVGIAGGIFFAFLTIWYFHK